MSDSDLTRDQTDESLRAERIKTDSELGKKRAAAERSADAVIVRARSAADEVLQTARDTADDKAVQRRSVALIEERSLADDALERERSDADGVLQRERQARNRALSNLLVLEREETDQHLLTERGHSDEALGTRDTFLAMVSHDLRNSLGGIAMAAERLPADVESPGGARAAVLARAGTIRRLAAHMSRLLGDLVDVAAIEAGTLRMAPAELDLHDVLREAVQVFRPAAEKRSVELSAALDGPPLLARLDRERILQVVANLLGNALKFSPRGARIALRAERSGAALRVSISDAGPGIAAQDLEVIFEKFRQAGRPDRTGLGLGLYISRSIVEAHGGRVWAESAPGGGSTFLFTLPAA